MNNRKKIYNKNDWAKFVIGYLRLAALGCQEIIEKKYINNELNMEYSIEYIYIPALFNLKHGIEILLKTFSIEFLDKEILDQSDYSHDIEEIFSKLRKEVKEERLKKAIEKHEKKNPNEKESLSGKNIFDELEKIVRKYHNLDHLKEKISTDYIIIDVDNTAFKYPTNSLNIHIDYEKLSKKFIEEDARQSLLDSIKLEKILWQLYFLLYVERT